METPVNQAKKDQIEELERKLKERDQKIAELTDKLRIINDPAIKEDEKIKVLQEKLYASEKQLQETKRAFEKYREEAKAKFTQKRKEMEQQVNGLKQTLETLMTKTKRELEERTESHEVDRKNWETQKSKYEELIKSMENDIILLEKQTKEGKSYKAEMEKLKAELERVQKELKIERSAKENALKKLEAQTEELTILRTQQTQNQLMIQELDKVKSELDSERFVSGGNMPMDFYDGIIQVNGLTKLQEGWKIMIKDHPKFKELINKKGVVVTVVGNYNKGKTFLIEMLSGLKAPHGFSISTEGISIKYLEDPNYVHKCPIIALDTQGGSLPVLIASNQINVNLSNPDDKTPMDAKNATVDSKSLEELYRSLLRDHHATEDLLQNFIMEISTVIIIVVSDLTRDDQRLIAKIQNKFKNNSDKRLLVVHNLYHCRYKWEVEGKIKKLIKGSFHLSENLYTFETNYNSIFYEECNEKFRTVHVILAKHGSEAGKYYNESTLKYLQNEMSSARQTTVDIVTEFKNFLKKTLPSYVEVQSDEKEIDIKIEVGEGNVPTLVTLENKRKIQLKSISADELGLIKTFTNKIQPHYAIYREGDHLVMKIECPGPDIKPQVRLENNFNEFRILVRGKKVLDEADNKETLYDDREHGEFFIMTSWITKPSNLDIKRGLKEWSYANGSIILKWECEEAKEWE